ncbi:MAG: type II CAAX endopeptidase family protein [Paracoccus sp. (in: a-proteobacteria)]|uniref:CPBP family intramembrane glutamic endopeptidase n=1 Tax=Paracoccus sp. TaxID=267 RepID=UPI0026DEC0E7|nr:type II CAAX endopeptidase family protein [Paracoccus sp. (in: a-proteobacteria)]MDO5632302.1 type II CAAX endopeptidase family protein [Paracoccus sp. (in: a-proteobacteria)]
MSRFTAFTRLAAPRTELWRTVLGFALIAAGTLLLMFAAAMALLAVWPNLDGLPGPDSLLGFASQRALAEILTLAMFGLGILVLAGVLRLLHRRGLPSLIGPDMAAAWRDFRRCFLPLLTALAVLSLFSLTDSDLQPWLSPGLWLVWAPVALIPILIQISAEELIFRGYLQQQLGARFRSPWVWMLIPSAFFGMLHFNPELGGFTWPVILITGALGLVMADLTARVGNLGPALALHFANNIAAVLLVSTDPAASGIGALALYHAPPPDDEQTLLALIGYLLIVLILWLIARLRLRV